MATTIQYTSDLHLEFPKNRDFLIQNPIKPVGKVLLLAGDIIPLVDNFYENAFFDFVSTHFELTLWVAGNHEYYHCKLDNFIHRTQFPIRKNVLLVNNAIIHYNDIAFVCSTLWSKISSKNERIVEQRVSDFELIQYKGRAINSKDFNSLHSNAIQFICQALSESPAKKKVVVTHHLPSVRCNAEEFSNSIINEAFCVDLTDYIHTCGAKFWIYGHSHYNQKPLFIEDTLLLTNQLGYIENNEQYGFKRNAFFKI